MNDQSDVPGGGGDEQSGSGNIIRIPLHGLLRRAKADSKQDVPLLVRETPRSVRLHDMAMTLAEDGRDDQSAVEELVHAGQGHQRDLLAAAASVRMSEWHHEDRVFSLANRLLMAAAEGRAVQPLGSDELAHIELIEAFANLPHETAYRDLLERCPPLADAEARALAGAVRGYADLIGILQPIVGPKSNSADPIVRSTRAYYVAEDHLAALAGFATEADPADD